MPTKLTPSCAQATAELPRPRNGSAATRIAVEAVQPQAISGSRDGNVAGCGRSLSRLWMVS